MADGVCRGNDQSADSGVVGLMGRPTGYVGILTSRPTVEVAVITSQPTVVCLAVLHNHIDISLIIKIQYGEV